MLEHPYLAHYEMKENSMLVDLGATTGDFLGHVLNDLRRTNSHLLCIEPSTWAIHHLSNFIDTHDFEHASLLSCYTGATNGFVSFASTNSCLLNHVESIEQHFPHKQTKVNMVPILTLDTIIGMCGYNIDFIKCDIEGAELDTFLNCEHIRRIKYLAIAAYHIVDGEPTWKKLIPFFEKNDFSIKTFEIPGDSFSFMIYANYEGI